MERFKLIYAHVDDVDLFIAAISEQPVAGAILGPTFQVFFLILDWELHVVPA